MTYNYSSFKSLSKITKIVFFFFVSISSFAQIHTDQNGIKTSVINSLGADADKAKRYEVASVGYNSQDWQEGGIIIAELFGISYANDYKKYSIEIGYAQGGQGTPELKLIESLGIIDNSRIVLGSPSDLSTKKGNAINRQIPIYVDVRFWSHYRLRLTYQQTRVDAITTFNQIKINESSTGTDIDDFSVKRITYAISNGNVGIGTTNPQHMLDVNGNIRGSQLTLGSKISDSAGEVNRLIITPYKHGGGPWIFKSRDSQSSAFLDIDYGTNKKLLTIQHEGRIGIGVENPTTKLEVAGDIKSNNLILAENARITKSATDNFTYENNTVGHYSLQWSWDNWSKQGPTMYLAAFGGMKFFTQGGYRMGINEIGNVGIGVENPINKLEVNGTIRATEVKVETGWADFVFNEDYKLRSLDDVKAHIDEHKHLPDIPSEAEIKENGGVALGDMQVKLLQKIEELTLYVIDLKGEIEQLKKDKNRE